MIDLEEMKKRQILHTAKAVFIEKGYFSASMKDIAEACGMAKGSIYKIFDSKEDLFTAVFEDCHLIMFELARELDRQQGDVTPMERLRRRIEFQLQYTLENYFFLSEFKELPITSNEKFVTVWKKKRATMLTWHRDCFYEAYGNRIETYIWDIVAIFRGQLREYITYAHQKVIALPMAELALFLVERMDAIVNDILLKQGKPVLNESSIYFNHINPIDSHTQKQSIHDFLLAVASRIQELPKPEHVRHELQEVVDLLQREFKQDIPNKTLVHVYTTFLETVVELRPYVRQLYLMT
ncbi:TetR/AcrR family transcriptional regulator [Paenibacillus sp. WQ 127069]|uniref:TetR/AcrR family transcriptional regulator n=1 Tax=Paenibacillus baimaensis TaxID=2982185 RepID=A0ABT2ULY0_9BACL|nr:TetR/AcrR family transcriptional regulator [Paenibacillus sp. WQ 127069]MCU6795655.1 TetR/AcrR family transcriptional regulator [Paenibacillus sp. WQ 127069]